MSIEQIKRKENLIYIAIWLVVLILYGLNRASVHYAAGGPLLDSRDFHRALNTFIPLALLFLVNNYLLIPRLLLRHRGWLYLATVIVLISLASMWQFADMVRMAPFPHPMHDHPRAHGILPMPLIHDFTCAALVIGINLAISLGARQIVMGLDKERLVAANVESQLQQLKAQINPHFYMNMLNNIHGLVDTDPERAKDTIIDMSRLMQYMLYDSQRKEISLAKELQFLRDYIHIMHRRYSPEKVRIETSLPTDETSRAIEVPPLIFLVFIENAFKYGVDYRHESIILISLEIIGHNIHFRCTNSLPVRPVQSRSKGGIGLVNVRKRLGLIYGDRYSLSTDISDETYSVNLTIPTNET